MVHSPSTCNDSALISSLLSHFARRPRLGETPADRFKWLVDTLTETRLPRN